MSTLSKSPIEISQTTFCLQVQFQRDIINCRNVLVPASCEYRDSGNASWKIAVSLVDNKIRVTLYCRRKSSSDTFLAIYSVRVVQGDVIQPSNPYTHNVQQQVHATFSGPTLETTASIDLNVDSYQLQYIHKLWNISLEIHLISLELRVEDMGLKMYEDAFSSVDKAQLFSQRSSVPSDCVIVLKDCKEVHVSKTLLIWHSAWWEEEFVDDKDRVFLPNVDYDEFLELLSVIYPTAHPITVKNVETLSKLAYMFQMTELLKRCNIFLMAYSAKFGRSKLLLLAQNYNLERLQAQSISECKSVDDIKAMIYESEYSYLHDRTKRTLLDKILGINSSALSESPLPKTSDSVVNETRATKIMDRLASLSPCSSDIVLIVANKQIPAHKQFLSYFSHFFNNMFKGKFKESRESVIELEEVRYEEMVELISLIYPADYTVNETNIATIVKLADRFVMPIILERCKQELKTSNKIKGALKLWLAQRYNFTDMQEEFARQYKTIADVLKIKAEPEFEALDDKTRALILDSIIQQNACSQAGAVESETVPVTQTYEILDNDDW